MDQKYYCHCGLYCANCATIAKVTPAAQVLFREMQQAGFEDIIQFIPDGEVFWAFLKGIAEEDMCPGCQAGGGNPDCKVRICAQEKGAELCACCSSYPCGHFDVIFDGYPILKSDNALFLKDRESWEKMQMDRLENGFTYTDAKDGQ